MDKCNHTSQVYTPTILSPFRDHRDYMGMRLGADCFPSFHINTNTPGEIDYFLHNNAGAAGQIRNIGYIIEARGVSLKRDYIRRLIGQFNNEPYFNTSPKNSRWFCLIVINNEVFSFSSISNFDTWQQADEALQKLIFDKTGVNVNFYKPK